MLTQPTWAAPRRRSTSRTRAIAPPRGSVATRRCTASLQRQRAPRAAAAPSPTGSSPTAAAALPPPLHRPRPLLQGDAREGMGRAEAKAEDVSSDVRKAAGDAADRMKP